jgi:hypothetical protein
MAQSPPFNCRYLLTPRFEPSPKRPYAFENLREERSAVLLSVDLQGNARVLWEHAGSFKTNGVPSPDGRRLAIQRWTVDGSIWMMETF